MVRSLSLPVCDARRTILSTDTCQNMQLVCVTHPQMGTRILRHSRPPISQRPGADEIPAIERILPQSLARACRARDTRHTPGFATPIRRNDTGLSLCIREGAVYVIYNELSCRIVTGFENFSG